jgi:DNA-binding HxlR family transcriptional regulator
MPIRAESKRMKPTTGKKPRKMLVDESNLVTTLYFIEERGEIISNDLRQLPGTYDRLMKLVERMHKAGMVEVHYQRSPFPKYTIKITDKGKSIADTYRSLQESIEE